jgi:V/A-type H+-transporting ATPase subunit D
MADITNTSITRNEMLLRKQQIELTRAGYDLLDRKRLALLQEILRLQDEVVRRANDLEAVTANSRRFLAKAELLIGEAGVRSAAMGKKHDITLDLDDSLLMGVHVPSIKRESIEQRSYDSDLGITGTSPVVDETASAFEKNVQSIIYLADGEIQLARLMTEILKTTRRLKALEHIILHYIRNALEERERSEHFSLKLAKRLLDRKNTSHKKSRESTRHIRSSSLDAEL